MAKKIKGADHLALKENEGPCPKGGQHNYADDITREQDPPHRVIRVLVVCRKCGDSYQSE